MKLNIYNNMKTISLLFIISLFITGAVTDNIELVSINEGKPITLNTGSTIQTRDVVDWRFEGKLIARLEKERTPPISLFNDTDKRFTDRLKMNPQTGDLTITNTTSELTGDYQLDIFGLQMKTNKFSVSVHGFVLLKLEDSVTLHTNSIIQSNDVLEWRFRDELITKLDGRFSDGLKIKNQSGDLTIINFRIDYTGVYQLEIIRGENTTKKTFNVSVVFDANVGETLIILERDSIILHTDVTDIKKYDEICWRFQQEGYIAQINRKAKKATTTHKGRFKNKLQLNPLSGDLTIRNITADLSGLYEVDISSSQRHTIHKMFTVYTSEQEKSLSKMKGENVTLYSNVTEINPYDVLQWLFGKTLIAEIYNADKLFSLFDGDNGIFKGKLELNNKSGDLILTNITSAHTGQYDIKISSTRRYIHRRYFLTVNKQSQPSGSSSSWSIVSSVLIVIAGAGAVVVAFYYKRRFFQLKKDVGEKMPVTKGQSVNLQTHVTALQDDDVIEWMFKPQYTGLTKIKYWATKPVLAQIKCKEDLIFNDVLKCKFQDRLAMRSDTGDLTINTMEPADSGLYILKINRDGYNSSKRIYVNVCDEVMTTNKGYSVTLHTNYSSIQKTDVILWWFEDKNSPIAQMNGATIIYTISNGCRDKDLFKNSLHLNDQTGDLTINKIKRNHSGVYKLKIITDGTKIDKTFYVTVYDPNPNNRGSTEMLMMNQNQNEHD